ncbi:hypothetical protein FBU30_003222 [Linnemannia zychae]|nr:hypothetical protein FBU30_003222 [Linnemannia zychae]
MAQQANTNIKVKNSVGGVGVPGARIELMKPQDHLILQQQQLQHDLSIKQQQQLQHNLAQQQLSSQKDIGKEQQLFQYDVAQQQQYYQQEPSLNPKIDREYEETFFSQPDNLGDDGTLNAETVISTVRTACADVGGNDSHGYSIGSLGVPGVRIEDLDSMESEMHQLQHRQPLQQHLPQQSSFSQTNDPSSVEEQGTPSNIYSATTTTKAASPTKKENILALNGFDDKGLNIEHLPPIDQQDAEHLTLDQAEELEKNGALDLDSVQHTNALRPHVGPFDPPEKVTTTVAPLVSTKTTTTTSTTTTTTSTSNSPAPPSIVLQRQATSHHDEGMTSSSTSSYAAVTSMTSTTTSHADTTPNKIHIASPEVISAAQAAQVANETSRGRRRSSLAVLADKIRNSTSRSRSRSRSSHSSSLSRRLSRTLSRHSTDGDDEEEAGGPYKDVKIAQQELIARIRAEQEKQGITHNADGIPIPPPPERQRRRSSVSHILGFDKPLLSR